MYLVTGLRHDAVSIEVIICRCGKVVSTDEMKVCAWDISKYWPRIVIQKLKVILKLCYHRRLMVVITYKCLLSETQIHYRLDNPLGDSLVSHFWSSCVDVR